MYQGVFMSTVIDSFDSDVTILAQRLRNCFELIQDHRLTAGHKYFKGKTRTKDEK
jgi:hypothetical protein